MDDHFSVDGEGRVSLPANLAARFGLLPGAQGNLSESANGLFLPRPVSHLARLYIEPTNRCNLDCRTCMRREWSAVPGFMSRTVFERILKGAQRLPSVPAFFFGGYGEPLFHPDIVWMVERAKDLNARVELITNGILLGEDLARRLVAAGLDFLWVSLDGASSESYADIRLGAALPQVLENLRRLRRDRILSFSRSPELGISFVAMKRNIADLSAVIDLGLKLGAIKFSVSNVEAYTEEMQKEVLYMPALKHLRGVYRIALPRLDGAMSTEEALKNLIGKFGWSNMLGCEREEPFGACPFVQRGSASIRWDGRVSPCLPLLYSHTIYLDIRVHRQEEYVVGSVAERDLQDIWEDTDYRALRERLLNFEFAPCTICNGCELTDLNGEDCFGNVHPACGSCLWAQGFIQCP